VNIPANIQVTPAARLFAPARLACGFKRKWKTRFIIGLIGRLYAYK